MPRPSRQQDRLLIRAALELVPHVGLAELNLREVARRAGVNVGMFHYHFGSKKNFQREVLKELYERFFQELTLDIAAKDEKDPRKVLAGAVYKLARFVRDNRKMVLALAVDIQSGSRDVARFARKNLFKHIGVLLGLIRDCERAGQLRREPLALTMAVLMGCVLAPLVVVEAAGRVVPAIRLFRRAVVSDAMIRQRIHLALAALDPETRIREVLHET